MTAKLRKGDGSTRRSSPSHRYAVARDTPAARAAADVASPSSIAFQNANRTLNGDHGLPIENTHENSGCCTHHANSPYVDRVLEQVALLRVRPEEASKLRIAMRSHLQEYPAEPMHASLPESIEDIVRADQLLRGDIRDAAIKLIGSDPGRTSTSTRNHWHTTATSLLRLTFKRDFPSRLSKNTRSWTAPLWA